MTLTESKPMYFRTEARKILVCDVREGDWLFDIGVTQSEPADEQGIWKVTGVTSDQTAGFALYITADHLIEVQRTRPVGDNECRSCGRTGVKYSSRHLCNTCYQREHRAKQALRSA